jgi:site-specific recombinase XerD
MEHRISILFYARKSKSKEENASPVYMRITVNGGRIDQTTNRMVDITKWSADAGRLKGNTPEAKSFNSFLDTLKNKVYTYERELIQDGKEVTLETFRAKWLGVEERPRMLMEIFQHHNDQLKELVGKEYAEGTLERYITSREHTRKFLKWKFRSDDIDIKKLNYEFVSDYEFWLKTQRKCAHNTAMKYISNFKKITNLCIRRGWLTKDPFLGFKMTKREVERGFLTEHEIETIASRKFLAERLNNVRDIFLFSCFTGLAYIDVKKLRRSEIALGIDGEKWIFTRRQKTETPSRIPLLPLAAELLEKYKDHPQCKEADKLLPVPSNQKMNAYLKEIADVCSINKNLTFHLARHTFATTVTLSNGVPIETVSKMLGHKNLKTTQHYAKILDSKVSEDMKLLREKYKSDKGINFNGKSGQ